MDLFYNHQCNVLFPKPWYLTSKAGSFLEARGTGDRGTIERKNPEIGGGARMPVVANHTHFTESMSVPHDKCVVLPWVNGRLLSRQVATLRGDVMDTDCVVGVLKLSQRTKQSTLPWRKYSTNRKSLSLVGATQRITRRSLHA